jgi:hypothetical protein
VDDELRWFTRITNVVDAFYGWFRRELPPKILAVILVVVLLLIGLATCHYYETWLDRYTVFGFYVTLFGFLFTLYQLNETKLMGQLRAEEYKRASEEFSRLARHETKKHYRYCLETANATLDMVKDHERTKDWPHLLMKLDRLIDLLRHLDSFTPSADDRWQQSMRILRQWHLVFVEATNKNFDKYNPPTWISEIDNISNILAREIGLFYISGDNDNAI